MKTITKLFSILCASFILTNNFCPLLSQAQEFSDAVITPTSIPGTSYSDVSWGDYDKDNDLDMLIAGSTSLTTKLARVYRNDGNTDNGFVLTEITTAGLTPVSDAAVAWVDYDNDNDPDILLTGWDGASGITKIYRNDSGTFTDIGAGLVGFYGASLAWGDYDKDNDLDLIITGYTTGISTKLYRNDGGAFSEVIGTGFVDVTNGAPGGVAWVDYDNDSYLDLMIIGNNGTTRVAKLYRNNGNGTFSDVTTTVFPNYGPGQDHRLLGVDHGCIAWGDFNNDGYKDLAYNGNGSATAGGLASKFYYYQYNWDGTYQNLTPAISSVVRGTMNGPVAWGDYNNDGYLDLLVGGYATNDGIPPDPTATTRVYVNYSASTFQNIGGPFVNISRGSGKWADLDNDYDLDLVVTGMDTSSPQNYYTKIYRNNLTYYIEGTVSGATPLSGTTIELAGEATSSVQTNSSGLYSFSNLESGEYTITPSRTNYVFEPTSRSISINGSNQFSLNFAAFLDSDGDGVKDVSDNCLSLSNPDQLNSDGDAQGNACDNDDDNDGISDSSDCASLDNAKWRNKAYSDNDSDGVRDNSTLQTIACFGTITPTGYTVNTNGPDNCVNIANSNQFNTDKDSLGDVCDSDDDNDGVEDSKEVIDGTNPLDRGSFLSVIHSPVYTKYNTYLGQDNFLELIAVGTASVKASVYVYSKTGKQIGNTLSVKLSPGQERDISINAIVGPIEAFGLVKVTFNESTAGVALSGRMSSYRLDPGVKNLPIAQQTYSFAFGREFTNPVKGESFAFADSANPQSGAPVVENWAELINLESKTKQFAYKVYNSTGKLVYEKKSVSVAPMGEVDLPAGHNLSAGKYLVQVIPVDSTGKYLISVAKYAVSGVINNQTYFSFANSLNGRLGSGDSQIVPVSQMTEYCWKQSMKVNLANTLSTKTTANIVFRNSSGKILKTIPISLNAKAQSEVDVASKIGSSVTVGTAEVVPSAAGSLITQSTSYFKDCSNNSLQTAYSVPGLSKSTTRQYGSYNRYLSMNNVYLLTNTSNQSANVALTLKNSSAATVSNKSYKIPAYGALKLDLSNSTTFKTKPDTYGTVSVTSSLKNQTLLSAIRLRQINGTVDFAIPTAVR